MDAARLDYAGATAGDGRRVLLFLASLCFSTKLCSVYTMQRGVPAAGDGRRRGQEEEEVVQAVCCWRQERAGAETADNHRPADDTRVWALSIVSYDIRTRARSVWPGFLRNFPHYCSLQVFVAFLGASPCNWPYVCRMRMHVYAALRCIRFVYSNISVV
jgi:hypothetical protein